MAKKVVWVLGVEHEKENLGMVTRAIRFLQRKGMKSIALELESPSVKRTSGGFFAEIEAERTGKTEVKYLEHDMLSRKVNEWGKKSGAAIALRTGPGRLAGGTPTGKYADFYMIGVKPLRDYFFSKKISKEKPDAVVVGAAHADEIKHYLKKDPDLEVRTVSMGQIREHFSLNPMHAIPRLWRKLQGKEIELRDEWGRPNFTDTAYERYRERQRRRGTKKKMPRPLRKLRPH